jgi:hypothetical protein
MLWHDLWQQPSAKATPWVMHAIQPQQPQQHPTALLERNLNTRTPSTALFHNVNRKQMCSQQPTHDPDIRFKD